MRHNNADLEGRKEDGRRGSPRSVYLGLVLCCASILTASPLLASARTQATQPSSSATPTSRPTSAPADSSGSGIGADDTLQDLQLLGLEVPTVVSASRREQKVNTLPYAVSVLTQEDIRLSGARSIPDALRLVPGMDVADLSYGNAAVSPRGLQGFLSRQVLVLVDGRQLFDSLFGGTLWGSWPFQLEDIQRIEVIRGPGGVIWGANAVNGVINIITKDPKDQLGLTATGGGGSRGVNKEHLGYAAKIDDKLRVRVSGEYEGSDGFKRGGTILQNSGDEYKAGRMTAHAIYEPNKQDTVTLSGGTGLMSDGFTLTPLNGLDPPRHSGSQASYLMARWNHEIASDNAIQLTGYVNDSGVSSGELPIDYRYQQIAFQLSHSFQASEHHRITWGVDSRTDLLDTSNADPMMLSEDYLSNEIIGLYLQDEWRLAPQWMLTLGGRIDYDFYGGFEPSARASLAYEITKDHMVYAAVSRAFQMAPLGIRFLDIPLASGLLHVSGQEDIHASQLIAYEMGYRGRLFDRLDTSLNLFCNSYKGQHLLHDELGPPGLINSDVRNGPDHVIYGLEWDGKYAVNDKLTLLGNYTFEQMDWQGHTPYAQTDLLSPPRHKFMLGTRYSPIDVLHLSSHLYFVDDVSSPNAWNPFMNRHIDSYLRWDLRAEYELWQKRASVSVGVTNLLDSHHPEGGTRFMNNTEVPRMIYAEIRIRLGE